MNPVRRKKLVHISLCMLVLLCAVSLVLYALRQNINLFYSPSDIALGQAPLKHAIRVGGVVVPGSIVRGDGLNVQFKLTDNHQTLLIAHNGILPDLFREGQGIVVEGMWVGGLEVQAKVVLAKHDENYMPPEVKAALNNVNNPLTKVDV